MFLVKTTNFSAPIRLTYAAEVDANRTPDFDAGDVGQPYPPELQKVENYPSSGVPLPQPLDSSWDTTPTSQQLKCSTLNSTRVAENCPRSANVQTYNSKLIRSRRELSRDTMWRRPRATKFAACFRLLPMKQRGCRRRRLPSPRSAHPRGRRSRGADSWRRGRPVDRRSSRTTL